MINGMTIGRIVMWVFPIVFGGMVIKFLIDRFIFDPVFITGFIMIIGLTLCALVCLIISIFCYLSDHKKGLFK